MENVSTSRARSMPIDKRGAGPEQAAEILDIQPLDPGVASGPGQPRNYGTEVHGALMDEMMIGATIIAHPLLMWLIPKFVSPGDFWFPFPGAVYAAILRIYQYAGAQGITFSAVQREVELTEGTKFSDHFRTLYQLLGFGRESREEACSFARTVRNRARLRQVEPLIGWLWTDCSTGADAVTAIQDMQRRLARLFEEWAHPQKHDAQPSALEEAAREACARGESQA